tara:strand:- start:18356 stop:19174 length:819 start_codon:yes stop_codon:yes gene_type:complete
VSLLISINLSFAVIYGEDNRIDYVHMANDTQNLANSSVAIIPKNKLKLIGDYFYAQAKSVGEVLKLCESEPFIHQPQLANCSGVLVGDDKVLTAAHCIDKKSIHRTQNDYYIVFGYVKNQEGIVKAFHKSQVFTLKKELYYNFDPTFKDPVDLAIYQLDRASGRSPVKINYNIDKNESLFVLGYPMGIPLKFADDAEILSFSNKSFRHHLDTFSVNSGSPLFNAHNELIGIHVRGTGLNSDRTSDNCNIWGRGDSSKDYGEANTLKVIKNIL